MPELAPYIQELLQANEPLEPETEKKLLIQAQEGDIDARNKVVMANIRYLVHVLLRYITVPSTMEFQDLLNIGIEAMCRAVASFDSSRQYKFITYAHWWIRKYLINAIYNNLSLVHIPKSQIKTIERLDAIREELANKQADNDEEIENRNVIDIAYDLFDDEAGDSKKRLSFLIRAYHAIDVAPFIEAINGEESWNEMEKMMAQEQAEILLAHLNSRERDIVQRHYGIGCAPQTYKEIADYYLLHPERIRQIHHEALEKMRGWINGKPAPTADPSQLSLRISPR